MSFRRETAFSPQSIAGSSEAKFNGSLFCDSRRAADRRWGFGARRCRRLGRRRVGFPHHSASPRLV